MNDLLDILMKDPIVKKEIILRAKKSIKDLVFTKEDATKIKTAIRDMIIKICDLTDDEDDSYYEIRELLTKEVKKIIINKFSDVTGK